MNKLSLWLNCRTVRIVLFRSSCFLLFSFNGGRTVSCRTRSPCSSRSTGCPRNSASRRTSSSSGRWSSSSSSSTSCWTGRFAGGRTRGSGIQQAAAQVPQQAVGQAQPGELEVEYVYFCRLCVLFFINYEQGQGRQPFICLLLCLCSAFPLIHCSRFSHFFCLLLLSLSVIRVYFGSWWLFYG